MSRLEAEMQVYTEDAGEYTLGLLDKGNGKARGIWFFVWGVGRLQTWIVVSFFYMMNPPHRKMNEGCPKKSREYFNGKIDFWPAFFRTFFLVLRGILHQLRFFFPPPPFQTVDLCRCNFAVRLGWLTGLFCFFCWGKASKQNWKSSRITGIS